MSKRVLIATAFYNYDYEIRIKYLEKFLKKKGYDYRIVTSDFDHRNKVQYHVDREKVKQLHTPEYSSNLSLKRIFSHFMYAKRMFEVCVEYEPDIIYAITPPNFMFYFLKNYKRNYKSYLICEIEDLWPESLPVSNKIKKMLTPVLQLWAYIRNKNIDSADFIVYECSLFEKYLKKTVIAPGKTIYLSKTDTLVNKERKIFNNTLEYVYLGSVNNLIDIDIIIHFMKKSLKKYPSVLHIIGGGEKLDTLTERCEAEGVSIINHGIIYDSTEKERILKFCHFAFNIMKPTVYVGATMKSLEYFHYGLPVINNIKGDTTSIISEYGCGMNVTDDNKIDEFLDMINEQEINYMSEQSRIVYERFFSPESFEKSIVEVLR